MDITIIGLGNMGFALYSKLKESKKYKLNLIDPKIDNILKISKQNINVKTFKNLSDFLKADEKKTLNIILAIKPNQLIKLKKELSIFTKKKLEEITLISIVAGVSVSALKNIFKTNNIIRAMPNTPSIVGVGMTGLYMPKNVSNQKKVLAQDVFSLLGKTLLLKSEKKVDAVTAISGSGPAYFFKVIEILTETGEKFGLSKKEALLLVTQTAAGSISLLEKSQESPATLRKKVTSPGGTTEAALKAFEKKLLTEAITAGVFAARDRSLAICSELNSVFNKKT